MNNIVYVINKPNISSNNDNKFSITQDIEFLFSIDEVKESVKDYIRAAYLHFPQVTKGYDLSCNYFDYLSCLIEIWEVDVKNQTKKVYNNSDFFLTIKKELFN